MTKTKLWGIFTVLGVVAVLGLGNYLAVSPLKASAAKARTETAATITSNDDLRLKITRLKKEEANVPIEEARIAAIDARVPSTPALPAYVRFLTVAAATAHVELVSIAPTPPGLVLTKAAPAAAAAGASAAPAAGKSSAPAAAPAPAPASALSAITVSYNVVGNYFALQAFLRQLEKSPRVTVVSTINVGPGSQLKGASSTTTVAPPTWQTLSAQITATIFMSSAPTASIGTAATPKTPTTSSAGTSAAPAAPAGSTAAPNS